MDAVAPTSTVVGFPATPATNLIIPVSISGSDHRLYPSGVSYYDLYVSDNGGAYSLWNNVYAANPTAYFSGQSNHTYSFYRVARDYNGNVESKSPRAEATRYLPDLSAPITSVISGSPAPYGLFTLNLSGRDIEL